MNKRITKIVTTVILSLLLLATLAGCGRATDTIGKTYTIPLIDLSEKPADSDARYDELYKLNYVDKDAPYLAHPDSVLFDNGDIMTMYSEGHGQGKILSKISSDGGATWGERLTTTPRSWENSKETPTVYRLEFNDNTTKLIMISANASWGKRGAGDGFMVSLSEDDGATWSEFQKFYGKTKDYYISPLVAMASLTKLKDSKGNWRDAWMGFFHDEQFRNYKTILTFENGEMKWSVPEPYFAEHRKIEKSVAMCEVEVIRSDKGQGDELMLLTRSNGRGHKKYNNSMMSISRDEGVTWSEPKELPQAVSGERLKAEYLQDGRLYITFRSIERDPNIYEAYKENHNMYNWYSEGWIAWVGTYDDLANCREGQYRIKVAHTYRDGQTAPTRGAHGDTGYCGNVVLKDGVIVTTSYGQFGLRDDITGNFITSIASKRIDIKLVDELYNKIK